MYPHSVSEGDLLVVNEHAESEKTGMTLFENLTQFRCAPSIGGSNAGTQRAVLPCSMTETCT